MIYQIYKKNSGENVGNGKNILLHSNIQTGCINLLNRSVCQDLAGTVLECGLDENTNNSNR